MRSSSLMITASEKDILNSIKWFYHRLNAVPLWSLKNCPLSPMSSIIGGGAATPIGHWRSGSETDTPTVFWRRTFWTSTFEKILLILQLLTYWINITRHFSHGLNFNPCYLINIVRWQVHYHDLEFKVLKVENCFLKFSRCCSCITFCQHRHQQPSARSRRCDVWKIIFGQQWRRLAWTICS